MNDLKSKRLNSSAGPYASISEPAPRPAAPKSQSKVGAANVRSSSAPPPTSTSPLEPIFDEIGRAVEAELFHAAMAVALTIPDVCAAMIHDTGKSESKRYAAWFDENMQTYADALPGAQAYKLRCGLLHQARSNRGDMAWPRVFFGLKGAPDQTLLKGNTVGGVLQPDTYVLGVAGFCKAIVVAARSWYAANADNPNVKKHGNEVVRYRSNALKPMVLGVNILG